MLWYFPLKRKLALHALTFLQNKQFTSSRVPPNDCF